VRQVLNVVYVMLTENREQREIDQLDWELGLPFDAEMTRQERRQAEIRRATFKIRGDEGLTNLGSRIPGGLPAKGKRVAKGDVKK